MSRKVVSLVCIIAVVICASVTFYLLNNNKDTKETDAVKFSKEYTEVSKNNVFVYRTAEEIITILEKGTGVVFFGFPSCPWCQAYAPMLDDVAKDVGIDKIFYYDIKKDRENNTKEYQKIVSILEEYLETDAEGKPRVYVPDVTVVNKGEIVGHDNETSLISDETLMPDVYWTKELKDALRLRLEEMMMEIVDISCSSCDE